jgi:proteasome lid subunit RPN8/RPN11
MPFRLLVPRNLYEEMLAQAFAEKPLECCGLLAGSTKPAGNEDSALRIGRVSQRYPLINAAKSELEFLSDERGMLDACRDIDRRGLDILAVYHSHPTTDPIPSRKDLERNLLGEDVVNLIISLRLPEVVVRGWWLGTDSFREAVWEVEEAVAAGQLLPAFSADGVDLTLIRWMLSLTPAERLNVLQQHISAIMRLRHANPHL